MLPAVAMLAGAIVPWAYVLGRLLSASPTALMWTFWAGLVTLAAAMAPRRGLAIASALAGGATAVAFAIWQTGRIVELCGISTQCVPGPGLCLLAGGGVAAIVRGMALARRSASSA